MVQLLFDRGSYTLCHPPKARAYLNCMGMRVAAVSRAASRVFGNVGSNLFKNEFAEQI